MYFAKDNQIFYFFFKREDAELFITIHPTKDCTLTPERQAEVIAELLNSQIP